MAASNNTKKTSNDNLTEIKELISEVKNNMMTGEDCNNQFYSIIQSLDGILSGINNIENEKSKPSDEYTVLQTNLLEIRRELSKVNANVDAVICSGLKEILEKLSEKVNRLEILSNNTGINKQLVENSSNYTVNALAGKIKESADTLYSQGITSVDSIKKDIAEVNDNMRKCTEYLEKSWKETSGGTVRQISDDLTVLGVNIEKNSDNLKRSLIDLFTKIQAELSSEPSHQNVKNEQISGNADDDFETIKNGLSNLNVNMESHLSRIGTLISELDIFKKLESFSRLKNLPAIGDLKHTLQNNIERITDEYSYTLQSSQSRNELDKAAQQFRNDVYNEIISMLGNVSEYITDNTETENENSSSDIKYAELKGFADKIEELASVTELNNAGYDNLQIELKDVSGKCTDILTLSKQSGEIVRECAENIINSSTPDRNEIKTMLSDIKRNISLLQSGGEETGYTYSMQDIESDIAKIRVSLNELGKTGIPCGTEEFSEEMNGVIVMVDAMKQQLNKMDECNLSDTLSKITDDLTSVSSRVNKLILSSDSSYNLVEASLKEFKLLSEEINEQIKSMSEINKLDKLEAGISCLKSSLDENCSYNNLINQSLVMLAEWVDSAGETICNISEKQEKLKNIDEIKRLGEETKTLVKESSGVLVSSVQTMLEDTNGLIKSIEIADHNDSIKELEDKIVLQNRRLDEHEKRLSKLDEKLTNVLELAVKNDYNGLAEKLNDIDLKIGKLNKSIERITSYVNED